MTIVAAHVVRNDLPEHPLRTLGFLSIGCAPCTRAVEPGEPERAGRWVDADQTECGLHADPQARAAQFEPLRGLAVGPGDVTETSP